MASFYAVRSIRDIPQTHWQACLKRSTDKAAERLYPFLDYRFLSALEDHHCIDANITNPRAQTKTGWLVYYLIHEDRQGNIEQILPCFIKQHSYGEYVFDWSWADAYDRHGLDYYPKLLLAAPFTPATGPRVLGCQQPDWQAICAELYRHCQQQHLSGFHINFIDIKNQQQLTNLPQVLGRQACQFLWFNRTHDDAPNSTRPYRNFADYLAHFTSRKRKNVNKERQKIAQQHITLVRKTAADISPEDISTFYHCYQMTYALRRSRGYLNEGFFQQLRTSMPEQLLLVCAQTTAGHTLACALYLFDDTTLYGRYWGALSDIDALHFEACYYQGIEFCIERGLQRFDPGTQGEHKISRGFQPILSHSAHRLLHPEFNEAVANFLNAEQPHIEAYQREAETLLPFKAEH